MGYQDLMQYSGQTPEAAPQPEQPKTMGSGYESLTRMAPQDQSPLDQSISGSSPLSAEPESPLGIVDRARLGWLRTPQAQKNFLEHQFGKDNVTLADSKDGHSFVIKDSTGKWKQADPGFEWNLSGSGALAGAVAGGVLAGPPGAVAGGIAGAISPSFMDKKNLKDLPGDVAQFAGEYGPRAWAAGTAAAMAAPSGPLGMVAAGAVGAMGADMVETTGKMIGAKMGVVDPAATPQTKTDLYKQLMGSALFGATQEAGALAGKAGFDKATKFVAKSLETISDTPTGQWFARKSLSVITGRPESETAIRVADPKAMVSFDTMARADDLNNTNTVGTYIKNKVNSFVDEAWKAKSFFFKGYNAVEDVAGKLKYDPSKEAQGFLQALTEQGYAKGGRATSYQESAGLARSISANERGAIEYAADQARKMLALSEKGKTPSYKEIQQVMQSVSSKLFESDGITDGNLRRLLNDFQIGLKNHTLSVLREKQPGVADALAQLDAKYGPLKNFLTQLSQKTEDGRVDTFIKQILKDDGSFNSELASQISTMLGINDPTKEILRAHVARNSTALWGGKKILGVPIGSPRTGAAMAGGYSGIKQATQSELDSLPYLMQFVKMLRGQKPEARKELLTNPQFLMPIMQTISGATVAEKMGTEGLLKQAGVTRGQ